MPNNKYQLSIEKEKEFWSKIDKKKDHECWLWTGYLDKDGYGRLHIDGLPKGIHRISWELTRKCDVPEGKMILHMCDNPSCGNPHHLYCGDALQNTKDRMERTYTDPRKFANNTKLHEGEIWLIRKLKVVKSKNIYTRYVFPENLIAKMFKVDQSLIHLIWNSEKWLSLEGTYA